MNFRGETKVERRHSRQTTEESGSYGPGFEINYSEDLQGAIMESLDCANLTDDDDDKAVNRKQTPPSMLRNSASTAPHPELIGNEMISLSLRADAENNHLSFLFMDADEICQVESAQKFALKLGCDEKTAEAKVVSIIGNTGEGKSYCLNRLFFGDLDDGVTREEAFSTSASQESCTIGVWAAYDPVRAIIVLDTEGLLGQTGRSTSSPLSPNLPTASNVNENKRMRQLLKVLALSDIVIYKTRAERLHSDLFYFLGDASKSYNEHFSSELQKVSKETNGAAMLGPTVIVFHETLHTDILAASADARNGSRSADTIIRDRLSSLSQDVSAFSKIRYFGVRRGGNGEADEKRFYARLRTLIVEELKDTTVRSPRSVSLIYKAFQSLNTRFSGDLQPSSHRSFPDEYFTCQAKCSACESRCLKQMNHADGHRTDSICIYRRDVDNKQYYCLSCYQNGRRNLVVPKASSAQESSWVGLATYVWSGFVLECRICGVIYRSRQHWYGNETPESMEVVHTEISHIWPGTRTLQGTQNAARRLLDGINVLSDTVASISAAPSKSVSDWMADQIAPAYWRPNSEIRICQLCEVPFQGQAKIHHCRSCGEGFCDTCSSYRKPVPERGWGNAPVRVCKRCFSSHNTSAQDGPEAVQVRKYGEKVVGTLNTLATAVFDYPLSALKDSARPAYWVPDEECLDCHVCSRTFDRVVKGGVNSLQNSINAESDPSLSTSNVVSLHHCRSCGNGVCDDCSRARKPVPIRGWDQPVRVCNKCRDLPSP